MLLLPMPVLTLKLRIVAVTVAAALTAAAGTAATVIWVAESRLTGQLLSSERSERERTAALLGSKLQILKASVAAVAKQVHVMQLGDADAMGSFLLGKPALGVLYDSIFIASADGSMSARVDGGQLVSGRPNVADRPYFKQVMAGDQPVVSEPLLGRVSGTPIMVVAAPVLGQDGRAVGIVAGSLRLQSTSLFADPVDSSAAQTRDLVSDRSGRILAHTDPTRILGEAGSEPGLETSYRRWHGQGSPIDTTGTAELTETHLVSFAGIPFSDWVLVRITRKADALAFAIDARRAAVLATVLAAAISSLLAGVVAWSIAAPIGRLRSKMDRLLAGDNAEDDPWPAQAGEINAISKAFQSLLKSRNCQHAEIESSAARLQAVLDNANVGIALTRNGHFELVSSQLCRTLGYHREQLLNEPTRLMHASDAAYEALSDRARPAFLEHGLFDGEAELVRSGGEPFWARLRGRAVVPGDRSHGTIWVIEDATAERGQRDRLSWAASHDPLTGLTNRAAFEVLLDDAVARAGEMPFCALCIDLDRFKFVNDDGGHAAGDAMLRTVSRALQSQLRKTDTLARLGGDEFAVLLPQCPIPQAQRVAEKLRAAVEAERLEWEGSSYSVGASIGLVVVNGAHADAAEVLRAADAACYKAKHAGRNQVSVAAD